MVGMNTKNQKPLNWAKTTATDHYGNAYHSFTDFKFVRCIGSRGENQKVYNVQNKVKTIHLMTQVSKRTVVLCSQGSIPGKKLMGLVQQALKV